MARLGVGVWCVGMLKRRARWCPPLLKKKWTTKVLMLNYDVILYIDQFLKSCDICKRKDIKIANRICVVCKKYVCAK